MIGKIYKIGGWSVILFAIALVILRVITPRFTPTVPELTQWANLQLHYPTQIESVALVWDGFSPTITLSQVEIFTPANVQALHVDKMKLRLKVWPLLFRRLQLDELVIEGAHFGIEYQDGSLFVSELPELALNMHQLGGTPAMPTLKKLVIQKSDIHFMLGQGRSLPCSDVQLWFENKSHLKIRGKANIVDTSIITVDFGVDALASAMIYCHWSGPLTPLTNFFPRIATVFQESPVDLETWLQIKDANKIEVLAKIQTEDIHAKVNAQFDKYWHIIGKLNIGDFDFQEQESGWALQAHSLNMTQWQPWLEKLAVLPQKYANILKQHQLQGMIDALTMRCENFADIVVMKIPHFQATVAEMPITAQGDLIFPKTTWVPQVDMTFQAGKIKVSEALQLLPLTLLDADLQQWLKSALLAGDILTTHGKLQGDLAHLPTFELYSEVADVHLNYAPHWPTLTKLNATLLFRSRELFIHAQQGEIAGGGNIQNVKAHIPDLMSNEPQLVVSAALNSTLQNGLVVIQKSPLKSLSKSLSPLQLEGRLHLLLGLELPLSQKTKKQIKVNGNIEVENANVKIPALKLAIPELTGEIAFTQESVSSQKLQGKWLGALTQFKIDSHLVQDTPEIYLTALGRMEFNALKPWFSVPFITGETEYSAQLTVSANSNQAKLTVHSSLTGVTVDAPVPFGKTAQDAKPLVLNVHFEPNDDARFSAKYGDDVSIAYHQGLGGHLHFGENRLAKFREDHILLVDGSLPELDFQQWKTFLTTAGLLTTTGARLEPMVELNVESLTLFGLHFPNTMVEANLWNVNFSGTSLKGHIGLSQHAEKKVMTVLLGKLLLTDSMNGFEQEMAPLPFPVHIKIHELILGKKIFEEVDVHLDPATQGLTFSKVKAKVKGARVSLSGQWDYLANKKISVKGKMAIKNFGDCLETLGFPGMLASGKGAIGFTLQWMGTPAKVDTASLTGHADFALSHGSVQGVNPGFGRILNLLNIDSVQRRLNFDFSDVTRKGLAFNKLKGNFQFGKGRISTNHIELDGPSAKIEVFGQTDWVNQGLSGNMVVMPNVTGSLPVAAAIAAGNPAVGAAVWMVDKIVGNKIKSLHRYHYRLAGTWHAPEMQEES